jgi:hypothetical protein
MRVKWWISGNNKYHVMNVYRAVNGTEKVKHRAGAIIYPQNTDGTFG